MRVNDATAAHAQVAQAEEILALIVRDQPVLFVHERQVMVEPPEVFAVCAVLPQLFVVQQCAAGIIAGT